MRHISFHPLIAILVILLVSINTATNANADFCDVACKEEALLYAHISESVYSNNNYQEGAKTWKVVKNYEWGAGCKKSYLVWRDCTISGFHAVLYTDGDTDFPLKQNQNYILAFAGTKLKGVVDWVVDIAHALNIDTHQRKQAENITKDLIEKYHLNKLVLTGHSLGGALAISIARQYNLPAFVFNPAPIGKTNEGASNDKIKMFVLWNHDASKCEIVTYANVALLWTDTFKIYYENPGNKHGHLYEIIAPNSPQWNEKGPFSLHLIHNMISALEDAIPEAERLVKQMPSEGEPGQVTFYQIAEGFTKYGAGTLHFRRAGTGDEDIHSKSITFDSNGYAEEHYSPSVNKPYGAYEWWITDDTTHYKSRPVMYRIIQPNNQAYTFGFEGTEKTPTDSQPPECLPDFVAKRAWITKSEHGNDKYIFETGDSAWINVKVKNEGCADSPQDIHVWYFLSHGEHEDSHSDWEKIGDDKIRQNELHVGQDKWEKEKFDIPDEPGVYNIVACADRVRSHHNNGGEVEEEHKSNDCSSEAVFTVFPKNHLPVGTFESATCDGFIGWTKDPDSTTGISVNFYAEGPSGTGTFVGSTLAITTRNDLGTENREHGFSFALPESMRNGVVHQVYAYGVDSLNGKESLLAGNPRAVTCSDPTYPDLVVSSTSVNHQYITPGQTFPINATVRNQGNGGSSGTTLRYFRSADSTITTTDTQMTSNNVSALPSNGTSAENVIVTAPMTTGTFWIGACVDAVGNESNINNNCSTGIPVTVSTTLQPDLVITSLQVTSFTSSSIQYSYTIKNVGTGPANLDGPTSAEYDNVSVQAFLSSDNIFNNAGDIAAGGSILGLSPLGELAPGETYTGSRSASPPADIAATPYITVKIDNGDVVNESNESNNTAAVLINETHPDLAVEITNLTEMTLSPGQSFTANAAVRNQGNTTSNSTSVHYYRSTDSTITPSDTQVSMHQVSSLQPGGLFSDNASSTAPNTPGSYWIGACVDTVNGETNTTNNCSNGVRISVTSPVHPDLIVQSPSVSASMLTPGHTFVARATVKNSGNGSSSSTTLHYYISPDSTITSGDTSIATDGITALAPNGISVENATVNAPMATGTFWIGACVDSVSGESNIGNNCSNGVRIRVATEPSNYLSITPIIQLLLQDTSKGCFPNLPAPILALSGTDRYEANGTNWIRYGLTVQNNDQFPGDLFDHAPHLPPCGLNINSSRTWVHVYNNDHESFSVFCALDSLDSFWFAIQSNEAPPSSIYVELDDRECDQKYSSQLLPIPSRRADVNGDGKITTTDAMLVSRFVNGLDMSQTNWIYDGPDIGDVNCSNSVDQHDVDLLQRYSGGLDMGSTDWCLP